MLLDIAWGTSTMTATIIPFPAGGSGGLRSPAAPGAVPTGATAPLRRMALPSGAGQASLAGPGRVAVHPRPGLPPAQGTPVGMATGAVRAALYAGPCRRTRGLRSMAATSAVVAASTVAPPLPARVTQPERLGQALDGLRAALARQAATLAAWRASLVELEGALVALQGGLAQQAGAMQDIGARIAGLSTDARPPAHSLPR